MPTIKSSGLILDTAYPACCVIDVVYHIKESLGSPLTLPECLADKLSSDWAIHSEDDLLSLFALMTGETYSMAARDNTYNGENDLSTFYVYTVYAPSDRYGRQPDWIWQRDCFVVVEIGAGGDPRYSAYGDAKVYRLDDTTLGDSGFFDTTLGWWAEPIDERYDRATLDSMNDRISAGYSSHPYTELESLLYSAPVWCERKQCYIGRFKDTYFPVRLMPSLPYYGG